MTVPLNKPVWITLDGKSYKPVKIYKILPPCPQGESHYYVYSISFLGEPHISKETDFHSVCGAKVLPFSQITPKAFFCGWFYAQEGHAEQEKEKQQKALEALEMESSSDEKNLKSIKRGAETIRLLVKKCVSLFRSPHPKQKHDT